MPKQCSLVNESSEVTRRVEQTLAESRHPALSRLTVTHEGGAIVLSGTVPTYYVKQLAQTEVARIAGVPRVDNRTIVQ